MRDKRNKLLAVALCLSMAFGTVTSVSAEGISYTNTIYSNQDNIVLISSARELNEFAQRVCDGNDYSGVVVRLAKDIDYRGATAYDCSIGDGFYETTYEEFAGIFDGAGHSIKGIKMYSGTEMDTASLFHTNSGIIKNLTLEDCEFSAYNAVGGIAVINRGVIENCAVKNISLKDAEADMGGIAVVNEGEIRNCYTTGSIVASTEEKFYNHYSKWVGGIVGVNKGKLYNSCNMANVEGTVGCAGGIAADSEGKMQNCYNVGKVNADKLYGAFSSYVYNNSVVADCVTSLQASDKNYYQMIGIERDNIILDDSEMRTVAFVEKLNSKRGENEFWVPWELRPESVYPLPVKVSGIQFASDIENGVVQVSPDYAYTGQKIFVTVIPDEGYEEQSVKIQSNGVDVPFSKVTEGYEFTMPASAVAISATFFKIQATPSKAKIKSLKVMKGKK